MTFQSFLVPSIFIKVIIALLSQVAIGVIGVISYRVISATAGNDIAGLIFFAISFNGVVGAVFDLGISRTIIREMAITNRQEHRQDLVNHYLFLYIAFSIIFFAGFSLWSYSAFPNWYAERFPQTLPPRFSSLLFATAGFAIITSYMQSLMIGARRITQVNYFETASAFVLFGSLTLMIMDGVKLSLLAVTVFSIYAMKMVAQVVLTRQYVGRFSIKPRLRRRIFLKTYDNLRFNSLISISLLMHKQFDRIIAVIFLPIEQVGYYTVIMMSLGRLSMLTQNIASVIFPEYSSKVALSDEQARRFIAIVSLNIIIMVPIYIALFIMADEVGALLVGNLLPDQAKIVSTTVRILSLYFGMNMIFRLYRTLISASRHVRRLALADVLALGVSLPLVVWLTWGHGLVGLSLAMCTFFLVSGPLTIAAAYKHLMVRRSMLEFVRLVTVLALLSSVIFGFHSKIWDVRVNGSIMFLATYFGFYLVYLACSLVVFPDMRRLLISVIQR
jgi:O-antigen/teichoic acid export membrane protein